MAKNEKSTGEQLQVFANFWLGIASAAASGVAHITKELHDYERNRRHLARAGAEDSPLASHVAEGLKIALEGAAMSLAGAAKEAALVRQELRDCDAQTKHQTPHSSGIPGGLEGSNAMFLDEFGRNASGTDDR